MPGQDRRGPDGFGPGTGKKQGRCGFGNESGTGYGRGAGQGCGRGGGRGRGFCRGLGAPEADSREQLLREKEALENQLENITARLNNT